MSWWTATYVIRSREGLYYSGEDWVEDKRLAATYNFTETMLHIGRLEAQGKICFRVRVNENEMPHEK